MLSDTETFLLKVFRAGWDARHKKGDLSTVESVIDADGTVEIEFHSFMANIAAGLST